MCGIFIGEAFGALIASGILDLMDGVFGYTAWRWLFFVEGILTILVAILALFVLPDFPEAESISWLTLEEHELARRRMMEDADSGSNLRAAESASTTTWKGFIAAVSDWKVWGMALALYFAVLSVSFFMYFPTIASTIGFEAGTTLLLCVPPWVFAAAITLWVCRHSDRTGERCVHVVGPLAIGIIGFLLSMFTMNAIIRYLSMYVFLVFVRRLLIVDQVPHGSDEMRDHWPLCLGVGGYIRITRQTCCCPCTHQHTWTER